MNVEKCVLNEDGTKSFIVSGDDLKWVIGWAKKYFEYQAKESEDIDQIKEVFELQVDILEQALNVVNKQMDCNDGK